MVQIDVTMQKVTVCIPIYNVEKYIKRCLESIVYQTHKELEIIIVNDCTPDNSMAIVENFAKKDKRIKIVEHECNKGLMYARKTGYMAASGDYITFCDSDDYLPHNAIESLYTEAIKTEADIVSGTLLYMLANGKTVKWTNELNYGNDKESALKSLLLGELRHNLCSKLFKRELLQGYKYQTFEHFTNGEDGCLFYQLIQNTNKIVQIDDITYNYLQNEESSSQVRYNNAAISSICIVNRIRHEVTSAYPTLDFERHRCITHILYELYSLGYAYSTNLNAIIKGQGLNDYLSLSGKYFSNVEKMKLGLKRHFFGPVMYVKSKIYL